MDVGHDRRAAPVGGIPPRRRQSGGDPVRAGHPRLRHGDPQRLRPDDHSGGAQLVAPPDRRRPVARHGAARQGEPDGTGRGRGRGGRHHRRGPSPSRPGAVGRRPVAVPRSVRAADARGPRHRRGDRAADRGAGVGGCMTVVLADHRTVGRLVTALAFLSGGPTVRQSDDPWPVLDHASQTYQTISTLTADFVQIILNPMIGSPDTTHGKLYQMRPSRFAMRFTQPKGDRIVADGRYLWLYTPSTAPGQVIRSRIPDVGTTGPNLIGQFVERPRERYRARYVRADSLPDGMADVAALVPTGAGQAHTEAVLWVGRNDGLVRRLEIAGTSGQRRIVILKRPRPNGGAPGRAVTFVPPAGRRAGAR